MYELFHQRAGEPAARTEARAKNRSQFDFGACPRLVECPPPARAINTSAGSGAFELSRTRHCGAGPTWSAQLPGQSPAVHTKVLLAGRGVGIGRRCPKDGANL